MKEAFPESMPPSTTRPSLVSKIAVAVMLATLTMCAAALAQTTSRPTVDQAPSPSTNLPAQKIGPNDLIAVSVYDAPEFSRTVRVTADGYVRLPMLKRKVAVADLMPADVETALAEALRAEQLLIDPYVTVTVVEYQSRPIAVAGEVRTPVTFQATARITLLEALTRAGGLTPNAGLEILISKPSDNPGQKTFVQRIPVRDLLSGEKPELNVDLFGGEEIRVPEAGRVYVIGSVKKPGPYRIQDALGFSIMKAIATAEGLDQYHTKQAYLYRYDDTNGTRQEIALELDKILKREMPDVPMAENDVLYIPDNNRARNRDRVLTLMGSVGVAATSALIWTAGR